MASQFNALLGKIVTISYQDGPEPVTKKGRLVNIEGEFLILETWSNRFYIKQASIITLKECRQGSQ